jgi:citrate/tricarballylate utilization protein
MPVDERAWIGGPAAGLPERGARMLTVCNACRYCEQFCPVFPAMEQCRTFDKRTLDYLANLCHNCGECLYACPYAPPHEFGIDIPRMLTEIRLQSYEDYCWPRALGLAFRRNNLATGLVLAVALMALIAAGTSFANPGALTRIDRSADFYAVMPHGVMVTVFGGVFGFVLIALGVGLARFRREARQERGIGLPSDGGRGTPGPQRPRALSRRALRDVLTLRHWHGGGADCVTAEETRGPWRRWFHHCTFYGFMLCFASTSVAAAYHLIFGWEAPYGYTSLPVILGTLGGAGLLIGPAGLLVIRTRRDPALGVREREGLEDSFVALLLLTSLTGLVLLVLRHQPAMPLLLIAHLGAVLALFLTLPYGKFVHGLYRAAALVRFARENADGHEPGSRVS